MELSQLSHRLVEAAGAICAPRPWIRCVVSTTHRWLLAAATPTKPVSYRGDPSRPRSLRRGGCRPRRGRGGRCRSVAAPSRFGPRGALAGDDFLLPLLVIVTCAVSGCSQPSPCPLVVPALVVSVMVRCATLGVIPARKVDQPSRALF